jgi:hypothetical protein
LVVIPGKSMRLSALVLSAAALAMVFALAGGHEAGIEPEVPAGASSFDLSVLAPASDEATLGFGRTLSQPTGRRSGPPTGAALLPGSSTLSPYLSAVIVLLVAVVMGSTALQARPSPRGPPAV